MTLNTINVKKQIQSTAPRIFGSETIADGISRASILLSKRDGVTQLIFRIRLYANLKDATTGS